ncbi:hypothetical protein LINPERPRIM_LOCUS17718 [Linum perenne]
MKMAEEVTREMEEFKAANDQMYNNAGEWKYEHATNCGSKDKHVFSRSVTAEPPRRSNKLIVASSTIPPSSTMMAASRNYRRARSEGDSKRQKRIVKYNSYAAESRMRASVNSGVQWFKNLV